MGKAIVILEIAQCCSVEVLKLMYGSETISILGPKIWDILSTKFKKKNVPPTLFKKKFRELAQKNCPCHLCKT